MKDRDYERERENASGKNLRGASRVQLTLSAREGLPKAFQVMAAGEDASEK